MKQIAAGDYDLEEPPADTAPWVGEMLGRAGVMAAALSASGLSQSSLSKVRKLCKLAVQEFLRGSRCPMRRV